MMGASSSSNGIRPPTPISTSERAAETFSEDAHPTNDRRQKSYIYKKEDQPRSQGPSSYPTLRTGEFWNQRPTAPSLSNVLPPKRETLLTYATQMTGWQSADSRDSSVLQHSNEVMELSRIISQLAMANHQLASAHNTVLARMEVLYLELSKDKEDQKRRISTEALEIRDDILRKRMRNAEESEETHKLEQRVVSLERLLATSSVGQYKQKGQEDNKPRSRIERFENSSMTRDTNNSRSRSAELCCESSQQRTNDIAIDTVSEVPEDREEYKDAATEGTDVHRCAHSDDSESSVPRIDESSCSASVDLDKMHKRRARLRDDGQENLYEETDEEMLSRKIVILEADRLQCRSMNEQLLCNLDDQKDLVKKLTADYEELKARYATVEADFHEHEQQYDNMSRHLYMAKMEITNLMERNSVLQSEKDTADARISTLEKDLQKSLLEKEEIRNAESKKASKLQAQLSEEVSDKKKQIKAFEDALQEIQRLKETIKTEKGNENDVASKEDIDVVDSIDEESENALTADRAATNIEEFKKELSLKREARHRAIAAVSSEMERLRKELDAEKEAHSETSNVLALLRSARSDSQDLDLASGNSKSTSREQEARERADENEKELRRAEALRLTNTLKVSDELRNDVRYQIEKVDDLRYHLETDPERHRRRIQCLAEVSSKSRESLVARERRTNELKNYLAQVLVRLGDRSFLDVRDDAGAECNRQLENINALKALYNERLRVLTELKDSAIKELTDVKQKLEYTLKKSENLEEELKKAEEKVDAQDSEITNLESQLGLTKADCRDLQNQMSLINGLFTQMLLGASSADMDLDRLTQLLQENHDLISDIAREESTEAAALPKLLLDLVEQVEGGKASQKHASEENDEENVGEIDRKEDDLQEENIAHNLPKVWRVLLELLSCHAVTSPSVSVASCSDPNSCYKSVDTPAGPRLVISVSKTYIRLKELILEKKHLEKEMNRMKQLNTHLESKLGEQEKRLSMVSTELAKTWNIVGRMQAQHQQLHTHEEILRYELQQKRKMLQELKQELEYCREKWESARQKNTNTELEWRSLRREFAARKALAAHDSFNSAESGFSDERGDDSDEEEEAIEGRIRHGLRRRTRKESPRAPTPDTESEQPTDTELSESKTGSSVTLEQRTPTPETEAELDEAEVAHIDSEPIDPVSESAPSVENTPEILDPLDQALTNVIQNLIKIDNTKSDGNISILREDSMTEDPRDNSTPETDGNVENDRATSSKTDFCNRNPGPTTEFWCSLPTAKTLKRSATSVDLPSAVDNGELTESSNVASTTSSRRRDDVDEITKSESVLSLPVSHVPIVTAANTTSTMPVFSIGPLPTLTVPCSSIKSVQFSDPLIVGPSNRFSPVFGAAELDNSTDSLVASVIRSSSSSREEEEAMEGKESSKPTESVIDSDSISVDSSSSLDTVREFPTIDRSPTPLSTSACKESATSSPREATVTSAKSRTPEEVLATRADRLKRLEEQADWLMKKMNATSKRGDALCTRLEELHDVYGEPPVPPPMPDILPSRRLPSTLSESPRQVPESSSTDGAENAEDESSHVARNDASSSSANEP
ncbi:myosin-9 isoform X2 [Linepithema humile]|uniref:myosin-9 isoform X2 n=1 Tax=Linepithema humile TaxID=83485 RepID=UPI00351EA6FF